MTRNRLLSALLILSCFITLAYAQTDQSRLAGFVRDASGAVIPGADVTVRNGKTGAERTAKANEQGYYVITNLSPASYSVIGKSSGLGPTEMTEVELKVGQERILDLVLQPAAV